MRTRLLVIGLVAGCGSDHPSTPDATSNRDANLGDTTLGPDGLDPRSGIVVFGMTHVNGSTFTNAQAVFTAGNVYGDVVGSAEGCTLFQDTPSGGLSAGILHITGTTAPIVLTPSGVPTKYDGSSLPAPIFTPGATITVTADGAVFRAFTGTVRAPEPVADYTAPATISRASGFDVTWAHGDAAMWLILQPPDETAGMLLCKLADTGSYTVSPAALALFPHGANELFVFLARVGENDVHVGSDEVDLVAMDFVAPASASALTP
jgi:hypothetical protein